MNRTRVNLERIEKAMQPSQNPNQQVVIYNTNTNVTTMVAQRSGMSGWSAAYLWMFGLGFITFGLTWCFVPLVAIVHLIVHLCDSSSAPAASVRSQLAFHQVNPNELAGDTNRAYIVRVLDLAFSGGLIGADEYSTRAFHVPTARRLGDLDRLVNDIPVELRHQAWSTR